MTTIIFFDWSSMKNFQNIFKGTLNVSQNYKLNHKFYLFFIFYTSSNNFMLDELCIINPNPNINFN